MSGYYDIHTHILPYVDDGAEDMEETKKLLQMEYEDGVRTIFVTPHYRIGMFEPDMERILEQYERVKKEAAKIGDGMRILLGCEFHTNLDMVEILDQGTRPCMGDTRCVLTEFSGCHDLRTIQERCHDLLCHGYTPIIAHAERYPALNKNMEGLRMLTDLGVYIQMNAESLVGKEGFSVKRFCKKVMKEDLLHFIGSDTHDSRMRIPLIGKCSSYLEKNMGKEYMEKILIENPRTILEEKR